MFAVFPTGLKMVVLVFINRTKIVVNTVTAIIYVCLLLEIFLKLKSDYVVPVSEVSSF
jgi:hypothetical protein